MKRKFYIAAFIFLGILLQFLVHAGIEIWYINLLLTDFQKYGFGLSWESWEMIHHGLLLVLLFCGGIFGFWQGKYWWKRIYVDRIFKKA